MATALLLVSAFLQLSAEQPAVCSDAASCRQAAVEAAEQKDFEAFHDLAWRAVQKGRGNDPELMLLLARAQSLSGRPGDALVMLRRLAEMGIAADAVDSEDFRRVRALPGWPDVEAAIAATRETRSAEPEPRAAAANTPAPEAKPPAIEPKTPARAVPRTAAPPPALERAEDAVKSTLASPAAPGAEEALRLPPSRIQPIGLAYDSVSRRFVLGDRGKNKLIVADEIFKRVNDLISAGSAGFGTLTAIEIDRRQGDLWVTSTTDSGSASVHKLQLVSGRVLARIDVPEDWLPAALDDISISDTGAVLLVDARGSRLLTVAQSGQGFTRSAPLGLSSPASIAAAGGVTYVAHREGLAVMDVTSRHVSEVRASKGVTLTGLRRIRWYRGTLVAIQDDDRGGAGRLVRIRMGRSGRIASALEVLDDHTAEEGSALTVAGDSAYYVARTEQGPSIRRMPLNSPW